MRQIALVDTDDGQPYAVDVFRGGGGNIHDWALHGEGSAEKNADAEVCQIRTPPWLIVCVGLTRPTRHFGGSGVPNILCLFEFLCSSLKRRKLKIRLKTLRTTWHNSENFFVFIEM